MSRTLAALGDVIKTLAAIGEIQDTTVIIGVAVVPAVSTVFQCEETVCSLCVRHCVGDVADVVTQLPAPCSGTVCDLVSPAGTGVEQRLQVSLQVERRTYCRPTATSCTCTFMHCPF